MCIPSTVLLEIGNMFNSSLALIFDRPGRDGYPFHHGCSVVELQWINKGVGHSLCKQVGGCSCWRLQNSSEWRRNNCSCLHTGHHAVIPCFDRCLLSPCLTSARNIGHRGPELMIRQRWGTYAAESSVELSLCLPASVPRLSKASVSINEANNHRLQTACLSATVLSLTFTLPRRLMLPATESSHSAAGHPAEIIIKGCRPIASPAKCNYVQQTHARISQGWNIKKQYWMCVWVCVCHCPGHAYKNDNRAMNDNRCCICWIHFVIKF